MKKLGSRGFSSKEFLIVMVGIAVALIGIMPIIFRMLEKTRNDAIMDSVTEFMREVDLKIFGYTNDGNEVADGCYKVMANGDLCLKIVDGTCKEGKLDVELDGLKPGDGFVSIVDNRVINIYNIFIGNKYVNEKHEKLYISNFPNKKLICE